MGVQVPSSALDDTPRFCFQDFGVFSMLGNFKNLPRIEEQNAYNEQNIAKWSGDSGGTDKTGFVKGRNIK